MTHSSAFGSKQTNLAVISCLTMIYQLSPEIVLLFQSTFFFMTLAIPSASSLHDLLMANRRHAAFHLLCTLTHADGLSPVVFFLVPVPYQNTCITGRPEFQLPVAGQRCSVSPPSALRCYIYFTIKPSF